MFDKILIANRGEIACRIIETAHRLGVRTVAVYSEADRQARHVALADEAFLLGPAPSRDSYLRIDRLLEVVAASGAQAVHPGYGFLSENAAFARALGERGCVFIGPPVAAIEAMGSKSAAKSIMEAAGVPLVPGYHGEDQSCDGLRAEAARCGYPVLLKAVAGGGGKGMRVVWQEDEFQSAWEAARREGESSFGNGDLLVEKYLTRPRHVEVQVFADQSGQAVYLGDRDCSVQRRHQKVVEEAPAPEIDEDTRRAMGEAAVRAAQAIDYVGAGTVEFLYEKGHFFFMEMNTRLQVEHPVTEAVTGQDLVAWQLQIASGEPLPLTQNEVQLRGHALEVRIYAEDTDADFMPATGTLEYLRTPAENRHVRVDTGVVEGDIVSHHYDPMIAKLIVWDDNRALALRRLEQALAEYRICGVTTNIGYLSRIITHEAFRDFAVDTVFIEEHGDRLLTATPLDEERFIALAAAYFSLARKAEDVWSEDIHSPFNRLNDWRLNSQYARMHELLHGGREHGVQVLEKDDHYHISVGSRQFHFTGRLEDDRLDANLNGHRFSLNFYAKGPDLHLFHQGQSFHCRREERTWEENASQHPGNLKAPMTGTLVAVLVEPGAWVSSGEPLVVMEAMKMEQTIAAPFDGQVTEIHFQAGDQVEGGAELLAMAANTEDQAP